MSKKRHLEYNPRLSYHYSQIPTTKRDIGKQLWKFDMKLPTLVIQCILHKDKADYYRFLLHAATTIEFLSRLVYWSKTEKQYKNRLPRIAKRIYLRDMLKHRKKWQTAPNG